MKLVYAHYPSLARAFASRVKTWNPGPAAKVLVVAPSARVCTYLSRRLTREMGAVSGVYFHTFGSLLHMLDAEDGLPRPPLLPGDNLQNFILKEVLSRPGLDEYAPSRGFVGALKGSLRDLADSLADPDVLEEHLRTSSDSRLEQSSRHIAWLIAVYRAYQRAMDEVPGYRSYQKWFEHALAQASSSAWLAEFTHICFYGFYDMTGRQLELFGQLKNHYSVTVFAPYAKHPAYRFAQKFFESNFLPGESEAITEDFSSGALSGAAAHLFGEGSCAAPGLQIANAAGPRAELEYAAKEMLKLAQNGMPFEDMALVVRSLEPYKNELSYVLEENCIPWQGSLPFTLKRLPLGVFCLNLLGLAAGGFDRDAVRAVVASPYFKIKNNWRRLIDACLVSRDYAQWTDLITPRVPGYDPAFLTWLERVKNALEQLDKPRPWKELAEAALAFLRENTDTSALFSEREKNLWREIESTVQGLERFASVRPNAQEGEFAAELTDELAGVPVHLTENAQAGVTVTDALNLRGLSFKAVFVLGMNEKSFPQVIKEDPIFKDYYRYVLRDGLGYWVNQKLERFEEEKLLFFTALTAAEEKLFVTYLRTDAEGKPAIPSVYLAELARACGLDLQSQDVVRVGARLAERAARVPVELWSARELAGVLALSENPKEKFERAGLLTPAAARSLDTCQKMRRPAGLTEYDGMISSGEEIFAKAQEAGFSPSALQDLGACPMKYFLSRGVGLARPDERLSRQALAPNLRGTAYHRILMDFYQDLYTHHLAGELFDSALADRLYRAADKNFTKESYKEFGIYPVIWEIILEDMKTLLADFVQKDARELDGFVPAVFETVFDAPYTPSENMRIKLTGIIDRIDVNEQAKTFRVVDYKSSRKGGKDLRTDIFKHLILQPFLYVLLAEKMPRLDGFRPDGSCLLSIRPQYARQSLTREGFEEIKPKADKLLAHLAALVKEGKFFINPFPRKSAEQNKADYCAYCPYGAICRKDSFKSLMRARHSAEHRALEELKK